MKLGTGPSAFDLSDITPPIDTIEGAVDLAVEVLLDYGAENADTRIARLARWTIFNLSEGCIDGDRQHCLSREHGISVMASMTHGIVRVALTGNMLSSSDARAFAGLLLKAADQADG